MSNAKQAKAFSVEAFFNDLTGSATKDKDKKGGYGDGDSDEPGNKEEKGKMKHGLVFGSPTNDSNDSSSSSSAPPSPTLGFSSSKSVNRRSSWDRGKMAITNGLRTLMSPNPARYQDGTDNDKEDGDPRLFGSRRENISRDSESFLAGGGKRSPAPLQATATSAAVEAAAATSIRPKNVTIVPGAAHSPARPTRLHSGDASPPSPGSPGLRSRALPTTSALSDAFQVHLKLDVSQLAPQVSRSAMTRADGEATEGPSVPRGGVRDNDGALPLPLRRPSSESRSRMRHGNVRPRSSNSTHTGMASLVNGTAVGGGSSSIRSPRLTVTTHPVLGSGSSGSSSFSLAGLALGSGDTSAFMVGRAGSREGCSSPEFVGSTLDLLERSSSRRREGSGTSASVHSTPSTPSSRRDSASSMLSKWEWEAPSSRRGSSGPRSRELPGATGSGGSEGGGVSTIKAAAEGRLASTPATTAAPATGSGNLGLVPAKKKKTFMEKFGDMLEAAAETAIPAAPGAGGGGAIADCRDWDQWDAGPLLEFMKEEARTMADKTRNEEIEEISRFGGEKDKLVALVKTWFVPFLSQSEFSKQKAAMKTPHVGTVDECGRCVPASSARPPSSSLPPASPPVATSGLFISRRYTAVAASSSMATKDAPRFPSAPDVSGAERGGSGRVGVVAGAPGSSRGGGGAGAKEGIRRAVVLGYVIDGQEGRAGGGCGSRAGVVARGIWGRTAPDMHYLIEVETWSARRGGSSWVCYKRYPDFRALWEGLSIRYPHMRASLRFPLPEGTGFLGMEGVRQEERLEQLTAVLDIMLDLNPRPQELVRFLEPHAVGRAPSPVTAALDAARLAAAKSTRESGGNSVDLSDVFAVSTASTAGARGGGGLGGRGAGLTMLEETKSTRIKAKRTAGDLPGRAIRCGFNDAGATSLPVTPYLQLFLGAVAVLQAGAALHAAGLNLDALAVSTGAMWVSLAVVVFFRAGLNGGGCQNGAGGGRRRQKSAVETSAAAIAAALGWTRDTTLAGSPVDSSGSGATAARNADPRGTCGSPAPTEEIEPSAAGAAATNPGETDTAASTTTVTSGGNYNGWSVRVVMAGEISTEVLLFLLRMGRSSCFCSNSATSSTSLATDDAFRTPEKGGALVASLAVAGGRWAAVASALGAAAVVTVVLPPLCAALATAHVAKTFTTPPAGSTAKSGNGSGSEGRSSPEPAPSSATSPPFRVPVSGAAAASGEPVLRRSISSSSIATDAHANQILPSGAKARFDRDASAELSLDSGGLARGRPPVIHLSEALLRLVVVGGGALSLLGGCWVGFHPLFEFFLRRVVFLVVNLLVFPLPRLRRGLVGSSSSSSSSSSSEATALQAVTEMNYISSTPFASLPTGETGSNSQVPAMMLVERNSVPQDDDNVQPTLPLATAESEPAKTEISKGVARARAAASKAAASMRRQCQAASAAARVLASRWKSGLSEKSRRWRVSLANKIMPSATKKLPATTPEDQESSGGGDETESSYAVTGPGAPTFSPPASPPAAVTSTRPSGVDRQACLRKVDTEMEPNRRSSDHEWQDWLGEMDRAVATVYSGAGAGAGAAATGDACGGRDGGKGPEHNKRRNHQCIASAERGEGRQACSGITAVAAGGEGSCSCVGRLWRGGEESGPFASTAEVALLWVVVVGVVGTVRGEFRLANRRKWKTLALLVIAKAIAAGLIITVSSLRLWGGGPALLVCAVEACRCVTVLALIFAAVQARIGPEARSASASQAGDGRVPSRRRTKPRMRYDPTTPRGEHLAHHIALPLPATSGWVGRNGEGDRHGGSRKRPSDVIPSPSISERAARVSSTSIAQSTVGGVGGGGGVGWFSSDSWHNSSFGNTSSSEEVRKLNRGGHPSSRKKRNNDSTSNVSRFLAELSTSMHGGGGGGSSSGGVARTMSVHNNVHNNTRDNTSRRPVLGDIDAE